MTYVCKWKWTFLAHPTHPPPPTPPHSHVDSNIQNETTVASLPNARTKNNWTAGVHDLIYIFEPWHRKPNRLPMRLFRGTPKVMPKKNTCPSLSPKPSLPFKTSFQLWLKRFPKVSRWSWLGRETRSKLRLKLPPNFRLSRPGMRQLGPDCDGLQTFRKNMKPLGSG